jgi:hypothetical protein
MGTQDNRIWRLCINTQEYFKSNSCLYGHVLDKTKGGLDLCWHRRHKKGKSQMVGRVGVWDSPLRRPVTCGRLQFSLLVSAAQLAALGRRI